MESPGERLECEVIPTYMATLRPSMTALGKTSPGRNLWVSPKIYSLEVVGSMVLATAVIALATAQWPRVASEVAQQPA